MTCRERASLSPEQNSSELTASGPHVEPPLAWLQWWDRQSLELHNRLHRHRAGWEGQIAGLPISVRWASFAPPAEPTSDVHLTLDQTALMLQLPSSALEMLKLGNLAPEDLDGLAGSMLLEHALLELIEPLEQASGHEVQIVAQPDASRPGSSSTSAPYALSMVLQVQIAHFSPWTVPLRMSTEAAALVAQLLEQHIAPAAHALAPLHFALAVQGGEAQLNIAELRSLRPGDVVMLDDWPEGQVRLLLKNRLHARAVRDKNTLTLLEQPIAVNLTKEHRMTESVVGASQDNSLDSELDATLDQLPLKLVCQVGSVELSIAQLRALGEGSLVQLTPQLDDRVDLMVNGRRLGQGQLIKIGDGLGVRLLSFATA